MLPFVVDLSLRISLAAALVGVVLWALRVRSGAARHAAWTGVLLTMMAMPGLTTIVPRIPVPVPSPLRADPGAVAAQVDDALTGPLVKFDEGSSTMVSAPTRPDQPRQAMAAKGAIQATRIDWLAFAFAVYLVGVTVLSSRLIVGWWMARRFVASATKLDLPTAAPVLESTALAAPLTVGIFNPSIVLPHEWRQWPQDTLTTVLAHEDAHVRRRDLAVQFLARVNRAVFWFHPVAWWLERRLAVAAEQACDDAVLRASGDPRRYSQILLTIAEAVSHRGGRIAWTAVGIDGSGLLGARIERVLRGHPDRLPAWRRLAAVACCGAALLGAIACDAEVEPLRPDPLRAEMLRLRDERMKAAETARDLSLDQVDALEARLEKDANDWDARQQLVIYYSQGLEVPWERKVPGLRRHALWLIEHHPGHDVSPPALSPEYDPEGFAEAVRLWESHLQTADVSPFLVHRAAQFFAPYDKPRAEQLILRGLAMDPESQALKAHMPDGVTGYQWPSQLGMLYASALLGSVHFAYPHFDAERARSRFAMTVRQKLAASNDARLLTQVGSYLARRADGPGAGEVQALGRSYLERAAGIAPEYAPARSALVSILHSERHRRFYDARRDNSPVADEDRLAYLAEQAANAVMAADSANYYKDDRTAAAEARRDAVKFAEEALALAAGRPEDPTYSSSVATARFVLATEAARDGDRDGALAHLMAATRVPPSDDIVYSQAASWLRPVNYLLKAGERERVIAFLEAFARLNVVQRERLLDDANAIREGRMPTAYQHMLARESAPGTAPNPDQERR